MPEHNPQTIEPNNDAITPKLIATTRHYAQHYRALTPEKLCALLFYLDCEHTAVHGEPYTQANYYDTNTGITSPEITHILTNELETTTETKTINGDPVTKHRFHNTATPNPDHYNPDHIDTYRKETQPPGNTNATDYANAISTELPETEIGTLNLNTIPQLKPVKLTYENPDGTTTEITLKN